jgi:hypothetical protein
MVSFLTAFIFVLRKDYDSISLLQEESLVFCFALFQGKGCINFGFSCINYAHNTTGYNIHIVLNLMTMYLICMGKWNSEKLKTFSQAQKVVRDNRDLKSRLSHSKSQASSTRSWCTCCRQGTIGWTTEKWYRFYFVNLKKITNRIFDFQALVHFGNLYWILVDYSVFCQ